MVTKYWPGAVTGACGNASKKITQEQSIDRFWPIEAKIGYKKQRLPPLLWKPSLSAMNVILRTVSTIK